MWLLLGITVNLQGFGRTKIAFKPYHIEAAMVEEEAAVYFPQKWGFT